MTVDSVVNPMMHDWNKVALIYCDGGSFSGKNLTTTQRAGESLYFLGGYILEAIMDTLLREHGLASATNVVVGGDSAGGLATYLHLDKWRAAVPPSAFLVGLPDSGFFLDWSASAPRFPYTYAHELRTIFWSFNASGGVNADCVASRAAEDMAECYFAEHTAPFIRTPFFALQSLVDSWQVGNELGVPRTDNAKINTYQKVVAARVKEKLLTGPMRGGWFDSCLHHTGLWDKTMINDTRSADGFVEWFAEQKKAWETKRTPVSMIWWQNVKYPCTSCCGRPYQGHWRKSFRISGAGVVVV